MGISFRFVSIDKMLREYNIVGNNDYLEFVRNTGKDSTKSFWQAIGGHAKIAGGVSPEYINKARDFIRARLSSTFVFKRICLINYGCEEKDIIWQLDLT